MYQLTDKNIVIRLADGAFIPMSADNADYRAYLAWVEEGNTPLPPAVEPPRVPQSVTMRQARLALLQAGILAGVNDAIAALPSPQKEAALIEWEYSQEVHRGKELVAMLAPALGLDDAGLDALFQAADAL